MVVVADTSPLNYLILIDEIGLLAELYQRILIPDLVFEELRHADAPPLMDEAVGRAEALDLIDLSVAFAKLGSTSFRAPASLMADLLARDTRRRSGGG